MGDNCFALAMLTSLPVALLGLMPAFWLDQRLATLVKPVLLVECTMSVRHMKNVLTQKLTFLHVMANICSNNFEVSCTVDNILAFVRCEHADQVLPAAYVNSAKIE